MLPQLISTKALKPWKRRKHEKAKQNQTARFCNDRSRYHPGTPPWHRDKKIIAYPMIHVCHKGVARSALEMVFNLLALFNASKF